MFPDNSLLGNPYYMQGIADTLGAIIEKVQPYFKDGKIPTTADYNNAVLEVSNEAKAFTNASLEAVQKKSRRPR